jgi:hypothetical protein
MSMPLSHMVAFCSDIGIGPARGAAMLSTQLAIGFVAQQMWGWLADRLWGTGNHPMCVRQYGCSHGWILDDAE